jgi:hypothetical protein
LEEIWLTVCVTRVWAGVDKDWEQKKLEARKMLLNRADSHTSGARFVGRILASVNIVNHFTTVEKKYSLVNGCLSRLFLPEI